MPEGSGTYITIRIRSRAPASCLKVVHEGFPLRIYSGQILLESISVSLMSVRALNTLKLYVDVGEYGKKRKTRVFAHK